MEPMCGVEATAALLNYGLDLKNKRDPLYHTELEQSCALHYWTGLTFSFTQEESLSIVKLLLSKDVDILHAQDNQGFSPIIRAANSTNLAVLEYLSERADVTRVEKFEALELAGAAIFANGTADEKRTSKSLDRHQKGLWKWTVTDYPFCTLSILERKHHALWNHETAKTSLQLILTTDQFHLNYRNSLFDIDRYTISITFQVVKMLIAFPEMQNHKTMQWLFQVVHRNKPEQFGTRLLYMARNDDRNIHHFDTIRLLCDAGVDIQTLLSKIGTLLFMSSPVWVKS